MCLTAEPSGSNLVGMTPPKLDRRIQHNRIEHAAANRPNGFGESPMNSPTALSTPEIFIDALPIRDLFVDHDYQRPLDLRRARRLAEDWERPLVGVIEVSDRGIDHQPRYAVIDGQHRYEAAKLQDPNGMLVANVHTGLSTQDEARLFYEIDAKRTRLTGWDRWNARRGAGDPLVLAVESTVEEAGLRIDPAPTNGNIRCAVALLPAKRSSSSAAKSCYARLSTSSKRSGASRSKRSTPHCCTGRPTCCTTSVLT